MSGFIIAFADGDERVRTHLQQLADAIGEIERLRQEVDEWRACARYDPMMEGPRFKGWDRSQMDRCRKRFIETAAQTDHEMLASITLDKHD